MSVCKVCGAQVVEIDHYHAAGVIERGEIKNPTHVTRYRAALYHHPETHEPYCGAVCAAQRLKPC
jgi:hypothetical protein